MGLFDDMLNAISANKERLAVSLLVDHRAESAEEKAKLPQFRSYLNQQEDALLTAYVNSVTQPDKPNLTSAVPPEEFARGYHALRMYRSATERVYAPNYTLREALIQRHERSLKSAPGMASYLTNILRYAAPLHDANE